MGINNTTILCSGIVIGISIGYLILDFCKYKYWIRDTTEEERRMYKK